MIAAPRLPTVGMKVSAIPGLVVDHGLQRLAVGGGEAVVRVHRRRMVAPDDDLLDGADRLAGLRASCDSARLWSRRSIAVKLFCGSDGADFMAM